MKIDRTGKVAYLCKTEELAKEFLEECDEQNIVWWCSKNKASSMPNFYYGASTCYSVDDEGLSYGSKKHFEIMGYNIIEYKGKALNDVMSPALVTKVKDVTESKIKTTTIAQIRELISDLSTLIATRRRIKSEITLQGIDDEIKRIKAILVDNITEV